MPNTIDRESLKQMMDNGEEFRLVEVLMPKEFQRLHIQGAENIPLKEIGKQATSRFGREDTIVVYCADEQCQASPKAAEKLEAFGYRNVYDYEGGKQDWVEAGYPVEGDEA
jgi:rhodanese-related sulfurtransferase